MRIAAEIADLRRGPAADQPLDTQALHGETIVVFEEAGDWAWAQLDQDRYVGWIERSSLADPGPDPTHRVRAPRTFLYEEPSIKAPRFTALPMGASLRALRTQGSFTEIEAGGFVFSAHLRDIHEHERDFVAVAERFLNAPYLWGGKSWLGVDCSGLVQIALRQANLEAPRDTDMMMAELGVPLPLDRADLRRGDLVFWRGHVAIMQNAETLLHANATHMQVASEPLRQAAARIAQAGSGEICAIRRL